MRIKKLSSLQGVRRFIATSGGHYGVQVSIYHVDGVRSAPDMEVALHAMELDKGWIIPNMDEVRGLANIYRALASASSSLAILAGHWGRRSATRMHAATHLLHAGFELERIPLGIIDATFGRRGVRKLVTAAARSVGERVVELARRLLERNTAKCRGMKVQEAIASLEGEIDGLLVRRVNLPPPPKSQNPKNRRQRSS